MNVSLLPIYNSAFKGRCLLISAPVQQVQIHRALAPFICTLCIWNGTQIYIRSLAKEGRKVEKMRRDTSTKRKAEIGVTSEP